MMLLLDVGNSSVKAARLLDGSLSAVRCVHPGADLAGLLDAMGPGPRQALASSVNPIVLGVIRDQLAGCGVKLVVVGEDVPVGIPIAVVGPHAVGTDRLVGALGARHLAGAPVVVVDAGSAITVDLVDSDGRFAGGAIMPGLGLSLRALHVETALLPEVTPDLPEAVVGKDTRQAMLSGVFWGALGAIEGLVRRMLSVEPAASVVLTGGDAELLKNGLDIDFRHLPDLVIEGLRLIADTGGWR